MLNWILRALCGCALVACVCCQTALALDVPYGYTVETEQRTPETGEKQRLHIFNKDKVKVGMIIKYSDGKSEHQTLNDKGKVKAKRLSDNTGKELSRHEYFDDGKLMREYRKDVLVYVRRLLPDGTWESIRYKDDGKSPQMLRRVRPDGSFELLHYRTGKSQGLFFTTRSKTPFPDDTTPMEFNYYGKDGGRLQRIVTGDNMVVLGYDKSGNINFGQKWTAVKGEWKLSELTVYGARTVRYTLQADGKTVKSAAELKDTGEVKSELKNADAPPAKYLSEFYESEDPTVPELSSADQKD